MRSVHDPVAPPRCGRPKTPDAAARRQLHPHLLGSALLVRHSLVRRPRRHFEVQEAAWRHATRLTEYVSAVRTRVETMPPGQARSEAEAWIDWAAAPRARDQSGHSPLPRLTGQLPRRLERLTEPRERRHLAGLLGRVPRPLPRLRPRMQCQPEGAPVDRQQHTTGCTSLQVKAGMDPLLGRHVHVRPPAGQRRMVRGVLGQHVALSSLRARSLVEPAHLPSAHRLPGYLLPMLAAPGLPGWCAANSGLAGP